ncbi:MAG: hypothetical protein E6K98_05940 [Thaumarchaeota archaeon]|nr:MAG: hypothetical protein E6K98_05940 [Nitrososphaerota archaeon]
MQRVLDEEHRIEWTKRAIEKLLQSGRGDAARFDSIMHLLEEEIPVPESEIKYLKEQYKVVLLIQHSTKKLEWVTGLIDNLRRNEIGDYQRLSYIKKAIEERKPLPGNEITYLKDKYKTLDIITKNSQNEDHKDTNEKEEIDYNSVLDGLNDAITQLQVLQAKN